MTTFRYLRQRAGVAGTILALMLLTTAPGSVAQQATTTTDREFIELQTSINAMMVAVVSAPG